MLIGQVNYADLSMGARVLRKGTLGEISIGNLSFNTGLRGLTQALQQTVGELTSIRCRADLGMPAAASIWRSLLPRTVQGIDANNCTITDSTRTEPGAASRLPSWPSAPRSTPLSRPPRTASPLAKPCSYHVVGMVATERVKRAAHVRHHKHQRAFCYAAHATNANTLVLNLDTRNYSPYASGGQLAQPGAVAPSTAARSCSRPAPTPGRGMEIKAYAPGLLVLASPMPYPLAVGDAYSLTPGCGKRAIEDCYSRYNNVINFRGRPYGPGMDEMLKAGGM